MASSAQSARASVSRARAADARLALSALSVSVTIHRSDVPRIACVDGHAIALRAAELARGMAHAKERSGADESAQELGTGLS